MGYSARTAAVLGEVGRIPRIRPVTYLLRPLLAQNPNDGYADEILERVRAAGELRRTD